MNPFHQILANTLVASITNFTIWFALTFWVYLETKSVFATGMIAGIYVASIAVSGFWFGSIVDHHRKRTAMLLSSALSFVFFAVSLALHEWVGIETLRELTKPHLWTFIVLIMCGVLAGNLRTIALPTLVTILIPEDRRDKANGLVGMTTGIGFLTTSVISGFLVAWGGMRYTLLFGLGLTLAAFLHLSFLTVEGDRVASDANPDEKKSIDLKGTLAVIMSMQKVVPLERQGRVFGFAQSVEQAAAPLTAFLIGPFTQFVVIPFMTTGSGAAAIGGWFGTGPARGIALVFTVTGCFGLIVTLIAFRSRPYRELSARYQAEADAGT